MDIEAIHKRIKDWTAETGGMGDPAENWREMTEGDLLRVYSRCMFSSQTKFETVMAFVERLENEGLFDPYQRFADEGSYRQALHAVLSSSLPGTGKMRMNGRRSDWIARVAFSMRDAGFSFMGVLERHASDSQSVEQSLQSARAARTDLTAQVPGLGPKTASMYLRMIRYYPDLGVLDTHIMKYLKARGRVSSEEIDLVDSGKLSNLGFYERIESKFQELTRELGFTVKCADEAIWMELSENDEVDRRS